MKLISLTFFLAWTVLAAEEGQFDFEFKGMDLHKAVGTIAKLMKKNVIFATGVESRPISFSLTDATPEVALKLLLESNGFIALERMGALQIVQGGDRGPASTSPTVVIPLKNVIAKDLENNVKMFINDKGTYSINEQMNAFIVSAAEDKLIKIRELIAELDKEANQVFIEGKIVETSANFGRDFGIQWGDPNVAAGVGNGISVIAPAGAGANFALKTSAALGGRSSIDMRLAAAEDNGEAKVLSSPKITTLNGVPATLESTRTFSVKILTTTAAAPGTTQTGGIREITSGLTLSVTPFIVSGDQVRLNINVIKSDPLDDGLEIPTVSRSSAVTSLVVRNRQTAAIGGLISNTLKDSSRGVPFFSSLPILGMLFGNNNHSKRFTELIIFMTPTIFVGSRGVNNLVRDEMIETPSEAASLEVLRGKESPDMAAPNLIAPPEKLPAAEPIPVIDR